MNQWDKFDQGTKSHLRSKQSGNDIECLPFPHDGSIKLPKKASIGSEQEKRMVVSTLSHLNKAKTQGDTRGNPDTAPVERTPGVGGEKVDIGSI